MANSKIRGITIEIGGDTTKLDKALGSVDKKVKGTQVELREVNKLLKVDPTNTEMLAQKQALLTDAISETKEKLDILKNAESQVQAQFARGEISEEQYKALTREIGRTEVELANLEEAAKQTDNAIEQLGNAAELSGEELKEAQEKAGTFKDKLDGMADTAVTAAKALGAGFVAAATYATKFETDCDKALNTVITQTGAADAEVEGLEETLLSIYKDNFGEDINDIATAMSAVKQQTGQTGKELKNTTEHAILMRDTFDIDVNESIRGVNAMMKQFGISADEAYNLLAQGAQKGLNQNGDLADQLAEYSVYYADLGLSAEDAFNMIANGAKNGTFQVDYLNDAVKEFGIGELSLPRLAKGGVLREGTAMVAEAGPELLSMVNGKAVVTPLTGSARNRSLENAGSGKGGYSQTINISSPKALSPYEVARQTRLQTRSMILAVQRG